ncbi:MAG: ribosome-associated translation inhibitor RaiA [Armatimonadota bacterium]|nr:ribosome-associated translation inhibitor RaiA [Armatimonadota bacterium]
MTEQKRLGEIPIRVQGKNLAVTEALRTYVTEKLSKLPRYFDQVQDAQVVLSVARDRNRGRAQTVEVTVWCDGLVLRAEEHSEDMYASIDLATEKLERQIAKYRSRMIEKRRQDESRKRQRREESAEIALRAGPDVDEAAPAIVRTKRFAMKPMTTEEAAVQLELLGHEFFVFRQAATQEINVLYRRRDGNYGLIEPE